MAPVTPSPGVAVSAGPATAAISFVLVFYLACVGWHVGLQVGGALLIHTGLLLHLFGGGPAVSGPFVGLGQALQLLRASTVGMIAFAGIVAAGVVIAGWRKPAPTPKARTTRLGALAVAAVLAFAADAWLEITPLGIAMAPPLSEPSGLVAARRIDVDRYMENVKDSDVGSFAQVTGILGYQPSMRRYELKPSQAGQPNVNLYVRAGRESPFSERPSLAGPDPRVVAHLQPMLGERVTVTGKIFRNQVSAQAGDVRLAGPRIAE